MLREIVAWRLDAAKADAPPAGIKATLEEQTGPKLWQGCMREEIPSLFGAAFNPGSWNQGLVRAGDWMILPTTPAKGNMASGNRYEDRFPSPTRMRWQSQSRTTQGSARGRILSGRTSGREVHLLVRGEKLRGAKAAPFLHVGQPRLSGREGEKPITAAWNLKEPVPEPLGIMLRVPAD